jgi:hypothetical protein
MNNHDDAMHYPIAGLVYLFTSPSMWGTVICAVLLGFVVALTTIIVLFSIALKPQAHAFGNHWWSYILAIFAVLFESLLATALILKVVHSKCQKRIFVETMQCEGKWRYDTMVEPSIGGDINCCKMGFLIKIVTFPLNLIPIAGTMIYAFVNAPFEAWNLMDMYFDALQMSRDAQLIEISGNSHSCDGMYASSPYVHFGFVATLLETIPIIGPAIFSLSNACGAALWACDMEADGGPCSFQNSKAATLIVSA